MGIQRKIEFEDVENLRVDPRNPRLGRNNVSRGLTQGQVLELMRDWTLDELAISFLESGFWPQEALVCVKEPIAGPESLVVVEGNRRLAALIYLRDALAGRPASRKWADIAKSASPSQDLFTKVPYILADSRKDVTAFLGFRHVTGIKQWNPAEKAEYIATLIEQEGMSYTRVMRAIGSKTEPVRRNYISYRILLQLEDLDEEVSLENIEEKFSVLYLSLRESGVQRFLEINIQAEPEQAARPVPQEKLESLVDFARWLFGTQTKPPLFTDSRHVWRFAKVLESRDAVEYLRSAEQPSFELAVQKAGGDEPELIARVKRATDEIEQALGIVHLYLGSHELQKAVGRFGKGAMELLKKFPAISHEVVEEGD